MRDAPTPSMQQYLKAKADHPDCLVLFRMGDFYETFYDDAVEAARILDIALTSRNRDAPDPIPMAGVPWHSANQYIARLVAAGKRVAICEQMEDPKQAKGLVRREVVRVITPGVLLDTEMPEPTEANHLVCVVAEDHGIGVVALDASTGAFQGASLRSLADLGPVLGRLVPREVLVPEGTPDPVRQPLASLGVLNTPVPAGDLDGAGPEEDRLLPAGDATPMAVRRAARVILAYVGRTWPALLRTVQPLAPLALRETVLLPPNTIRNLELVASAGDGRRAGSLCHLLDRTRTAMGSRLLRSWLLAPLVDIARINERLDRVEVLVREPTMRAGVRAALDGVPDVERLLTRLAGGAVTVRDLLALARAVRAAERCATEVGSREAALADLVVVPETLCSLARDIERTFVADAPPGEQEVAGAPGGRAAGGGGGTMVRRGVHQALDEALDMAENGRRYVAEYEARERERTGIQSLKVRYNRVFGYGIEVSRSSQARVPPEYQRRQTLANAERYVTEELSRLEQQITTADERVRTIQLEIFEEYRSKVLAVVPAFQRLAADMARLDVLATLAEVAHTRGYHRPRVTPDRCLRIVQGRHPTVEASLPPGSFVPNDFVMDGVATTLHILTGPNMAGKSTVMRQVALTVLLAQAGSFVPADEAEVGLVDAVFTRVGAMDDLAAGRSTFMVEMSEAAEILARATDRSLVVLDEIGRGTSTFDGVAIAWAMAEFIQSRIGCRTLFATHYHELTDLARVLPRTRNFSIAVQEWGGRILFLRKLVDGPANKSYGIQVARLAGLPEEVLARAREVLANLEAGEWDATGRPVLARSKRRADAAAGGRGHPVEPAQLDLFGVALAPEGPDPIVERLAEVDVNRLTPIEALQVLSDLVEAARRRVRT